MCSLFFLGCQTLYCQTDIIKIEKPKSFFPSLGGVQMGEIDAVKFTDSSGLQMSEPGEILSFQIQYWNGAEMLAVDVAGKQIPDSIALQIGLYNHKMMVFITDICAFSEKKEEHIFLPSMNLIPIVSKAK